MALARRFDLYVKADSSGTGTGDCPYSLKAVMYSKLKVSNWAEKFKTIPVDLENTPEEFLKLNEAGTTPVLVDKETGEVITDSEEITKYLNEVFPAVETKVNYDGPAVEAISGIFPKLVAVVKNSDPSKAADLKAALTAELRKLDTFLSSPDHKGKFLLGDELSELDCNIVPKLKHLVAADHFRNYRVPDELKAVKEYVSNAMKCPCFAETCPPDSEFVNGWKRHGLKPDPK